MGFGIHVTSTNNQLYIDYSPGAPIIPATVPRDGQTIRVPNSRAMSMEDAQQLFLNEVRAREDRVNDFAERYNVHLEQHQFDALVSFTYNFDASSVWGRTNADGSYFWNIAQMIRNGPPFVIDIFRTVTIGGRQIDVCNIFVWALGNPQLTGTLRLGDFQNLGRREQERNVFLNGY